MRKNKKCLGCGVILQSENVLNIGYTPNLDNDYCMRCFKVKNYGEVNKVQTDKEEYLKILRSINKEKNLVLYIVDILNIREDLDYIKDYLSNDIILVLNKRDVLPKSVCDEKILNYLKELFTFKDYIIVSSKNNYNIDLLYKKILKYKKGNIVYLVGETNAGKSSLINKMVNNYASFKPTLTISNMPETTLNKITISLNDKLTLIDTPGLIDSYNIIHHLGSKYYKILNTKQEIKPKTYQISANQSLLIGDFLRIDYIKGDRNSFTFYIPNSIKIKKVNIKKDTLKELYYQEYDIGFKKDLIIYGLGFIKIVISGRVGLYLDKDVKRFIRSSLI